MHVYICDKKKDVKLRDVYADVTIDVETSFRARARARAKINDQASWSTFTRGSLAARIISLTDADRVRVSDSRARDRSNAEEEEMVFRR